MEIYDVGISSKARKQLQKVPLHIIVKLQAWIDAVKHNGVTVVRKSVGYHDEPLKGKRQGQRSIRLSRSYRAIYVVDKIGKTHIAEVREVSKHEY